MKRVVHFMISCVVLFVLGNCGDSKSVRQLPHLGDTPYQQDSILVTYASDPERALTLLDSALRLGNISDYRGLCIRAKIYSKSLTEQRQDSAIIICKSLLSHDSVRNEPIEQENILDMLIAASRAKCDDVSYLYWATQKAALCQQQGEETERWRMEAEVGMLMTHLGQVDIGLQRLDDAIGHLDAPGSIDRMDAFIIAVKRKISALNDLERYTEVIPLAQRILDRLDHYEKHTKDYKEDSYRLSWSNHPNDRDLYMDFSRAQAWGFMAQAYAMTDQVEKARECLALFDQSGYGKTFSARRMIAPTQMALGMYDDALITYDEVERRMAGDTLNDDYALILRSRAIVARAKGHIAEALAFQTRYADLSKVVSDSLHKSEVHDYAARYHAKEQEMKIQQAESTSERKSIIIFALAALLLFALVFVYYIFSKNRIIKAKNRGLVRLIDENIRYRQILSHVPSPKEKGEDTPAALFARLSDDIRSKQLFLDPLFDRQAVCDRYHLTAVQVGSAFSQGSDYDSVSDFIRDCRLGYACELLKSTDMKIADVAAASGFSRPTTFNHDFKARYNLSPTKYRRQ